MKHSTELSTSLFDRDSVDVVMRTQSFTARAWKGVPLEVAVGTGSQHWDELCAPETMLGVQNGTERVTTEWRDGGRLHRRVSARDSTILWRKDHCLTDIRSSCSYTGLSVFLPKQRIEDCLQEDAENCLAGLSAVGPLAFDADPFVAQALRTMATEIKDGCPSGALFAQSLSIALLIHIVRRWKEAQERKRPFSGGGSIGQSTFLEPSPSPKWQWRLGSRRPATSVPVFTWRLA